MTKRLDYDDSDWGRRPAYTLAPQRPGPGAATREISWMRSHDRQIPGGLTRSQRDLFEQSIAMLKMAQVAPEDGPDSAGQILALLPPGYWNMAGRATPLIRFRLSIIRVFLRAWPGWPVREIPTASACAVTLATVRKNLTSISTAPTWLMAVCDDVECSGGRNERITAYAALNHNQIRELYGRQDDNYGGTWGCLGRRGRVDWNE